MNINPAKTHQDKAIVVGVVDANNLDNDSVTDSVIHLEKSLENSPVKDSVSYIVSLLALIMFVVVTSEFVVMALLPNMAISLNISLAKTGWIVTWFALSASFIGPVITLLIGRFSRHKFLILAVIIFSVANLFIALVQHYYVIVAIRILQGALLPAIISIVVIEAVYIAGEKRKGWAISHANLGIAISTVLGIPAGAIIAEQLGWPASFISLSLLGVISAALLAVGLPKGKQAVNKNASVVGKLAILWRADFILQLILSVIIFAGMFTSYTYIAVLLTKIANIDSAALAWILMGFGILG